MTAEELRALADQRRQQQGMPAPSVATGQTMTADDLRRLAEERRAQQQSERSAPTLIQHLSSQVTKPFGALRDAVRGPRDPREADTEIFTGTALPNEQRAAVQRGKMVTFSDPAYADVVRTQLGNRFIAIEGDENGYPIISYFGEDGQPRREYLNSPGLDWQDVDRGLSGALPFMLGAGAGNGVLRFVGASGVLPRMATQGVAAITASVGADQAARYMGSKQGTNLMQAGVAGTTAAAMEGLSGPAARLWRSIFTRYPVSPEGRLTGEAAALARRAGLDPDDMSERLTREFARDTMRAANPDEVAAKFRSAEFGIPTTQGQRSKAPDTLGVEEEMRRGLMGREAQGVMQDFDRRQRQAIEGAVRESVPERVAPSASAQDAPTLGQNIRTGTRAARDATRQQENELWSRVGEMFPQEGAFRPLPGALQNRVSAAGVRPDAELTPAAHRMLGDLEGFAKGEVQQSQYALLPDDVRSLDVDGMRRRLLSTYQSAQPGSPDARAAKAIYDGFNDWIDEAAERALLSGSPDSAAALRAARGFTRETKALFEPRTAQGQITPAARRIAQVMNDADSGQGVINALFGAGSPASVAPQGSVQAIQHMKDILVRNGQEQVWDDVRMAYWMRMALDRTGKPLSPGRLQTNIDGAMEKQRELIDVLFEGPERAYMQRLARALDDVVYTPPNPSGTSYELERMRRRGGEPMLRTALQTQSKRELFSKNNVLMSRIYSMLARRIPNVAGARDATALPLARQATSQDVLQRRPNAWFLAPLGGYAGAEAVVE